jgi:hypothetical protein
MKRITQLLVSLCTALTLLGFAAVPASASQSVGGALEFNGNAYLSTFPCPAGNCSGSFLGMASGSVAGDSNGMPWTAVIANATFSASYAYGDSCFGIGLAAGGGSINTGVGATIGTYGPVPGVVALPYPVIGVNAPFSFSWTRVGLTAILDVRLSINLLVVQPGPTTTWINVLSNDDVLAPAAFVPTTVPSCLGAPTALNAQVVGSVPIH